VIHEFTKYSTVARTKSVKGFLVEAFYQCTVPNCGTAWFASFADKKIASAKPEFL